MTKYTEDQVEELRSLLIQKLTEVNEENGKETPTPTYRLYDAMDEAFAESEIKNPKEWFLIFTRKIETKKFLYYANVSQSVTQQLPSERDVSEGLSSEEIRSLLRDYASFSESLPQYPTSLPAHKPIYQPIVENPDEFPEDISSPVMTLHNSLYE